MKLIQILKSKSPLIILFTILFTQFSLAQSISFAQAEPCNQNNNKFIEKATISLSFEQAVFSPTDGKAKFDERLKQLEALLKEPAFSAITFQGMNYSIGSTNPYTNAKTYQLSGSFNYESKDIEVAFKLLDKADKLDVSPSINVEKTKDETCINP